jgi:hypothetical protein
MPTIRGFIPRSGWNYLPHQRPRCTNFHDVSLDDPVHLGGIPFGKTADLELIPRLKSKLRYPELRIRVLEERPADADREIWSRRRQTFTGANAICSRLSLSSVK